MEVIIGVDPHKSSNTIAVLDGDEKVVTQRRFPNTHKGFGGMIKLVRGWPQRRWAVEGANGLGRSVAQRRWAVEGANGLGRSVAQRLVAEGEAVAPPGQRR